MQSLFAETGKQFQTINLLIFNYFADTSQQSSGDSDSETSNSTESEALLKFPQASDQVGNDSTNNIDDDGDAETYFNLPSSLVVLKSKLLGDYTTPAECPDTVSAPRELTSSEVLTLKHYIAWKKSNGTVLAYKFHAQVLTKCK